MSDYLVIDVTGLQDQAIPWVWRWGIAHKIERDVHLENMLEREERK